MSSILNDPASRVKLLKAGFSGSEIEWLHTYVFSDDITVIGVNWLEDSETGGVIGVRNRK